MGLMSFRIPRHAFPTRGFSLTELATVLGIVGLVLGGIWTASSMVYQNNKVQKAMVQTAFILSGYRTLYGTTGVDVGALADVTCTGDVKNGYFPSEMLTAGCTIGAVGTYPVSPWNGYVQVFADPVNQGIQIGYYNISEEGCNRYAMMEGNVPDIIIENVNAVTSGLLPPAGAGAALTPAAISAACIAGDVNNVVLTFRAR